MINDVLTKGFYKIQDPECFQFIDEHSVEWPTPGEIPLQLALVTPQVQLAYDKTQNFLAEKYIKQIWDTQVPNYVDLVNGLDDNVFDWHTDYDPGKVNLGILLYFNNTDADTGTAIEFRVKDTQKVTGGFYPQRYDVCIINQGPDFEHRVSPQKIKVPRMVASLHYWVE